MEIPRREFLKHTLGGALAAAAVNPTLSFAQNQPAQQASRRPLDSDKPEHSKFRGVNLGSWLVLEKWMVPTIYGDTDALDEYSLCLALGDKAKARLKAVQVNIHALQVHGQ